MREDDSQLEEHEGAEQEELLQLLERLLLLRRIYLLAQALQGIEQEARDGFEGAGGTTTCDANAIDREQHTQAEGTDCAIRRWIEWEMLTNVDMCRQIFQFFG